MIARLMRPAALQHRLHRLDPKSASDVFERDEECGAQGSHCGGRERPPAADCRCALCAASMQTDKEPAAWTLSSCAVPISLRMDAACRFAPGGIFDQTPRGLELFIFFCIFEMPPS